MVLMDVSIQLMVKNLPSVTTILGKTRTPEKEESLARWRQKVGEIEADKIRDNAAARGTIMHRILEGYIKGEGTYGYVRPWPRSRHHGSKLD